MIKVDPVIFLEITAAEAKKLNNGWLPRSGQEALVVKDGKHYWMRRERDHWLLTSTPWRLVDGVATLVGNR